MKAVARSSAVRDGGERRFGAKPELKWLPIGRLSVDMAYQRSLESARSQALVDDIAAGFEWALFGTVLVAPLPLGAFELMDGQHRVAGARRAGIAEVPATVIQAPTRTQRARIFADANRRRVAIHAFSLHHSLVSAGDALHLAIARLCDAADVEIPRYPIPRVNLKPRQTLALGALKKLVSEEAVAVGGRPSNPTAGAGVRTLSILRAAYPEEGGALQAHLILGLRAWLREHMGCDDLGVATALQSYGLDRLEKRVFSIGLNGARRVEGVRNVLASVVPYGVCGHAAKAPAPSQDKRKAAFASRNQDLLDRAKAFDPRRLQTPAGGAVLAKAVLVKTGRR